MKKLLSAVAIATILPLSAACSSSGGGDYCGTLKAVEASTNFKSLDPTSNKDAQTLVDHTRLTHAGDRFTVGAFTKVEAVAPADIKPEWTKVRVGMEELAKASPDRSKLDLPGLQTSLAKISTNVKSVCNLTF